MDTSRCSASVWYHAAGILVTSSGCVSFGDKFLCNSRLYDETISNTVYTRL
jgi:hypothetical protein